MLFYNFNANAQKIIADKVTEDGGRMIICEEKRGTNLVDKFKMFFAIGYIEYLSESKDISQYSINMSINSPINIQIPAGSRLLIKLMDNSTITLTTDLSAKSERKLINGGGGKLLEILQTNILYDISESDAEKLAIGVKKVRVENDNASILIEKEWKTDKIGVFLYNEFVLVKKSLNEESRGSSFEDGF